MSLLTSEISVAREGAVRRLCRSLNISEFHVNALKLHNRIQPYHNYQHAFVVALRAHEGAMKLGVVEHERRLLVLAALYHDYRHTAEPSLSDNINIARAILDSDEWLALKETWLTREDRNVIVDLIASTESSHRVPPRSTIEAVLMDADYLATAEPDMDAWFEALAHESGQVVNRKTTANFMAKFTPKTTWGANRQALFMRKLVQEDEA